MSGAPGRQSSSEVAHEAEDTRANLASTLEQLRANLQPANVMEEVVSNARIGAASVADNLVGVAKQYPIPSVLVAAGSALIMRFFSKRDGGAVDGAAVQRRSASEARADYVRVSMPRPPMLRNPSSFQPAPGRGGSTLPLDTADEARTSRPGVADAIRRRAEAAYEATSTQAGEAMQGVTRYIPSDRGEVKSKLATLFEEQPLVLGAIGLAIGAAIGAALPITEAEDSLMGSTAHRFRDQATGAARQEVDGLRAAAGEAIDNVRHSAEDNLKTVVSKAGDSLGTSRDV